jgi:4-alpha-glucanotransferase
MFLPAWLFSAVPTRQSEDTVNEMQSKRHAGVLLHPTSLPGDGASGELGPDARLFVDFLATAGFGIWQVLPLGPPYRGLSPYYCLSSYAGNPALISTRDLVYWGWLQAEQQTGPGLDRGGC